MLREAEVLELLYHDFNILHSLQQPFLFLPTVDVPPQLEVHAGSMGHAIAAVGIPPGQASFQVHPHAGHLSLRIPRKVIDGYVLYDQPPDSSASLHADDYRGQLSPRNLTV